MTVLLAGGCQSPAPPTVFAAASLSKLLPDLMAAKDDPAWVASFAGSNVLMRQLLHGATADVFISASSVEMDRLQQADLIARETRTDWLGNELVAVTRDHGRPIDARTIAVADEAVPAGRYARQALGEQELGKNQRLVFMKDEPAVAWAVANGAADAGFVYASTANRLGLRIVERFPDIRVVYPVAVLTSARHPEAARDFLKFLLTSPVVAERVHDAGFEVMGTSTEALQ